MMPPSSFKSTERVEVYGFRDESDEGVSHSRKSVTVCPRKLGGENDGLSAKTWGGKQMIKMLFDMQKNFLTWTGPYAQHQKYQRFCGRSYDLRLGMFNEKNNP